MRPHQCLIGCVIVLSLGDFVHAAEPDGTWKAGVSVKVITPSEPMWMAGYGARNKPAEGKMHDLHVKALESQMEREHESLWK